MANDRMVNGHATIAKCEGRDAARGFVCAPVGLDHHDKQREDEKQDCGAKAVDSRLSDIRGR